MIFTARGRTGRIEFDGQCVKIIRTRFVSRIVVGKGQKTIPISSISAVKFKPSGWILVGHIQFTLAGGNEVRAKFGKQTKNATRDENSVTFDPLKKKEFLKMRDLVESAIAKHAISSAKNTQDAEPSRLEKLKQLGELRDAGVLTENEFEVEKKKLLTDETGQP